MRGLTLLLGKLGAEFRLVLGIARIPTLGRALGAGLARPRIVTYPQPMLRTRPALLGACLLGALTATTGCGGADPQQPPLVLLVSIDTLRADALSCYGYERPTSPRLDALAAAALRFDNVLTQAPNTATSHASLFTGLSPFTHRVANFSSMEHGTPALPPAFVTLAERFADGGYRTAAFTDDGPLGKSWNLMQGFELLVAKHEPVADKVDALLEFIDDRPPDSDEPLFLFLHTYEVHEPYVPPLEWTERFAIPYDGPMLERVAEVRAVRARGERPNDGAILERGLELGDAEVAFMRSMYDAEIAYTDHELGRLFDELDARGLFDPALIAITSDHGEEFREHGRMGHEQLYVETLRVPLILRLPRGELGGRVVAARVSQFDLHPTLLRACGLPLPRSDAPDALEARDLLGELRERGEVAERETFAETTEHLYEPLTHVDAQYSVRAADYAFVERHAEGGRGSRERGELFELAADPLERHSLLVDPTSGSTPEVSAKGASLFERIENHRRRSEALRAAWLGSAAATYIQSPDEDSVRELERLGYIEPGG